MQVADFIRINLVSEYGEFALTNISVTEEVNQGVSWSANLADHTLLNPMEIPEGMPFTLNIHSLTDSYTSPPVVVETPSRTTNLQGRPGSISGYGLDTWRMSQDDLTLDTFVNSTALQVLNRCIQTEVGVSISGLEDFPIEDDDVKNSKIIDVLNRYAAYSGQDWFIKPGGGVQLVSANYSGPINRDLLYTNISDTFSYGSRVDSLKIEKTSKIASGEEVCFQFDSDGFKSVQLPAPLRRATPIDRSAYGYVYMVTTFNGTGPSAKVTGIFNFETGTIVLPGPQDLSLPTTHATLVVRRPVNDPTGPDPVDAKVCFAGQPVIPEDPNAPLTAIKISPAFRRIIGVGTKTTTYDPRGNPVIKYGTRPARDIWTDTLFPNADWINSHKLAYLRQRNRNYWPQTASCPLRLTVALLQSFTSPGHSVARINSFTHAVSVEGNTATTSINGSVPWPNETPDIDFW